MASPTSKQSKPPTMKYALILTLLIATQTKAQFNIGIGFTNKGANPSIGYTVHGIDIQAAIRGSRNAANPWLSTLSVGMPLYPVGGLVITPAIGYAYYSSKDFSKYIAPQYAIIETNGSALYGSFEIGYEKVKQDESRGVGRVFVSAQYCKGLYFGCGIRCFLR